MTNRTLVYLSVSCLLWALIPSLLFPNPPLDVVEGFAWGREMALGYTKHPPFPSWALEGVYQLTGGHVFGAYWLSAACLALGYLFLWQLGQRLGLSRERVAWGLILTSVTFYFTLPLPEFNHNIAQIPIWAAMMLLFHKALEKSSLGTWILLGIVAALGLYTKYFVLLLIGTIGLYALVFPSARRCLKTTGPYLAAIICLVLLIPHVLWLIDTDGLTLRYAASRSKEAKSWFDHILNPLNFLGAQIGNHAGLFLVVAAGFGLNLPKLFKRQEQPPETLDLGSDSRRFLLWFASVPLLVVLAASTITGQEFEHMWGTPMFLLSGFLAVALLPVPQDRFSQSRAFAAAVIIQTIFLGITFGQAVLEPLWKTKHTRIHYPGPEVALGISEIWQDQMKTPLTYVAGDMWSAANVTLYAPGRPHMFYLHNRDLSPWIDFEDVQEKGVMIVWRGDRETPWPEIQAYYPTLKRQGSRTFKFKGGGTIPSVTVNWAIIPPGEVALSPR